MTSRLMKAIAPAAIIAAGMLTGSEAVQAQAKDCTNYANTMTALHSRAQQERIQQCPGWRSHANWQGHFDWCQTKSPQTIRNTLDDWNARFDGCVTSYGKQGGGARAPAPQQPPVAASGRGCPTPGSIRSANSSTAATLHIANSSRWPLKIYWLDFQGQRKFYRDLAPGQNYRQPTYMTHPWIAVNPRGDCIDGVMKAGKPGNNIMEIFGDG